MEEEPSVLDYLKDKLNPRKLLKAEPPSQTEKHVLLGEQSDGTAANQAEESSANKSSNGTPESVTSDDTPVSESAQGAERSTTSEPIFIIRFIKMVGELPWRSLLALALALMAQSSLEPPAQNGKWAVFLYVVAALMVALAILKKEWQLPKPEAAPEKVIDLGVKSLPFFVMIALMVLAFLSFKDNRFSSFNVVLWMGALVAGLWAFWQPEKKIDWAGLQNTLSGWFTGKRPTIKVDFWKVLVLVVFLACAWFHLYQLDSIPVNMTSDHTEKLLDVNGILNGQYQIFFANNGGREPIHFYLTAFFVKVLHAGLNFFTLKLTMTLAFLVSLIYVYRLGKEMGNRWTGLFFMALLGFSAWANMITRVGLRLVLTPVFVAPVLFYLFRGLRTSRRNDFILAGILTGLGLLGYSAFRVMPLVVVLAVLIFVIYQRGNKSARHAWSALGLLALFALIVFLPLLRFAVDYPELIGLRTITRMTSAERQLPGDVLRVFFSNFWNCVSMPFWKNGNTWVISVPGRPGLDVVSAALYFIGLVLMFFRWLRSRRWQDLLLLLSIPILMLPSILALAFPDENPSLSRAGGALVPIFLITAIALEGLLSTLWKRSRGGFGKFCTVVLGLALVGFAASQNYQIALVQYPDQYKRATWNSAQMGEVAKEFIQLTGKPDNVWVVGVPYWVDTRLVALSAGFIGKDYAVWPKDLELTLANEGPKLFIVKDDDVEGMTRLKEVYPEGFAELHTSEIDGRNFYAYIVPPE